MMSPFLPLLCLKCLTINQLSIHDSCLRLKIFCSMTLLLHLPVGGTDGGGGGGGGRGPVSFGGLEADDESVR